MAGCCWHTVPFHMTCRRLSKRSQTSSERQIAHLICLKIEVTNEKIAVILSSLPKDGRAGYQSYIERLFLGAKRPGREADYSDPSSTEVHLHEVVPN
jgi:hypothetical protein